MRSVPPRRSWSRAPVVVLAVALAGSSACSASEWDTSEIDRPATTGARRYERDEAGIKASVRDRLSAEPVNLNEWSPSSEQAGCVADRLVGLISVDRMLDLGYEPELGSLALEFTADERNAVINILVGCIDYPAAVLELLSAYQKVPLRVAACISRGVERLGLDRRLAEGLLDGDEPDPFAGEGELATGLANLSVECTEPDDLLPNAPLPVQPRTDISDAGKEPVDDIVLDDPLVDGSLGEGDEGGEGDSTSEPELDLGGGSDGTGDR